MTMTYKEHTDQEDEGAKGDHMWKKPWTSGCLIPAASLLNFPGDVGTFSDGLCRNNWHAYAVQTGTLGAYTFLLEGSMDKIGWQTLVTVTLPNTASSIFGTPATGMPFLFFRGRCSAVASGGASNLVAMFFSAAGT